jgi:hypothetical protein
MSKVPSEIVEKLFFQYLGCDYVYCLSKCDGIHIINQVEPYPDYEGFSPDYEKSKDLLIVKPLSSITDEEVIEVAKLCGVDAEIVGVAYISGMIQSASKAISYVGFQYLQSKGYDLPQYLLGGKTLYEAGLAIYESELKKP